MRAFNPGALQTIPMFRTCATLVCCLVTVFAISACGGSGGSGSATADADAVEIGTPIQSGDWMAELIAPPEKIKIVGEGNITYQAEGNFVVVFINVTNQSDTMQVVARDLFQVLDDQGGMYEPVRSAVQVAYVLQHGMGISLDSPLGADTARESVVIFDIPTSASGLQFTMDGATETLDLGF